MVVEELIALLGFDLKGEGNLRKFRSGLDDARVGLVNFVAAATAFSAIAGAAIAGGAAAIGKSVIQTGIEFENLRVQLTALEGSSAGAEKAIGWIKDFAASTPLDLAGVTRAYASLRNFGIDPTNGSLQALTDTMAMSGKGQEHLDGIVLALGQAWSKEKLQGEEALQLIERGVPVWQLLGESMGKSSAEVQKLATAGKLGRTEIQLLIDAMGTRAAGAADKMSKTLSGITGRLGDMIQQFQLMIADAGFFDWFKEQVSGVADLFEKWKDDDTLKRLATQISDTFIRLGETLKSVFSGFSADTFANVIDGIGSIIEAIANFGGGVRDAIGAMGEFVSNLLGLDNDFQGTLIVLGGIGAIVAPWATAFAALVLVVDDFVAYLQGRDSIIGDAIDGLSGLFAQWGSALQPVFAGVKVEWDNLVSYFGTALAPVGTFLDALVARFAEVDFGQAFAGLKETLQEALNSLGTLFQGLLDLGNSINEIFSIGSKTGEGQAAGSSITMLADLLGKLTAGALISGLTTLSGLIKATAAGLTAMGDAFTKLSQGDLLGAWSSVSDGLVEVFGELASTVERVAQAFMPTFSYQEAWNGIKTWFDDLVVWFQGLGARIVDALTFDIPWPQPPAWLNNMLSMDGALPGPGEPRKPAYSFPAPIRPSNGPPMFGKYADHLSSIGAGGSAAAVSTIANDNSTSTVNNTVNAPVTVNAQTNASPQAIGASVRDGVTNAGLNSTRRMGVAGSSGGAAP